MKCMIQERNEIIVDKECMIWAEDQVWNVNRLSVKCLGQMRSQKVSRKIGEK